MSTTSRVAELVLSVTFFFIAFFGMPFIEMPVETRSWRWVAIGFMDLLIACTCWFDDLERWWFGPEGIGAAFLSQWKTRCFLIILFLSGLLLLLGNLVILATMALPVTVVDWVIGANQVKHWSFCRKYWAMMKRAVTLYHQLRQKTGGNG
jgi:hypothetical protein